MTQEDALETSWRQVLSRPLHASFCGCTMPGPMQIGPDDIERDLMDYLEDKHRLARSAGWVGALQAREVARAGSFVAWFGALSSEHELSDLPWETMRADVIGILQGMAAHARGLLIPAAELAPGWLGGLTRA